MDKETALISYISPDVTPISTLTITEYDGLTITPAAITKYSVVKATMIVGEITTDKTLILAAKGTTTIVSIQTVSSQPTTITQSQGSTATPISSTTPKSASISIKMTISLQPGSTTMTTVKPQSSTTISSVSEDCHTEDDQDAILYPHRSIVLAQAARVVRLGAGIYRAAATTTTVTISTALISFVKTSTYIQAGPTNLVTEILIAEVKTCTQPGATSALSLTSFVGPTTVAKAGSTHGTTEISTKQTGKITSLNASTTTPLSTS